MKEIRINIVVPTDTQNESHLHLVFDVEDVEKVVDEVRELPRKVVEEMTAKGILEEFIELNEEYSTIDFILDEGLSRIRNLKDMIKRVDESPMDIKGDLVKLLYEEKQSIWKLIEDLYLLYGDYITYDIDDLREFAG